MRAQVFPVRARKGALLVGDMHPKPLRHVPFGNCLFKGFIEFLGGCLEVFDQMRPIRNHVRRFRHNTSPFRKPLFLLLYCTYRENTTIIFINARLARLIILKFRW